MPRPSQEDKILAAALACFAELGYDATRVRHIAARAGVTDGALYRHFPSKEAVAQQLFRSHWGDYTERLQLVVGDGASAKERLQTAIRVSLACYRENPDAIHFILMRQAPFQMHLAPDAVYPMDLVEGVIRDGQRDGSIRDGQPNLLAAIFLGCLLRPLIVAHAAQPGALDILHDTRHDQVLCEAAWAAVARPVVPGLS